MHFILLKMQSIIHSAHKLFKACEQNENVWVHEKAFHIVKVLIIVCVV